MVIGNNQHKHESSENIDGQSELGIGDHSGDTCAQLCYSVLQKNVYQDDNLHQYIKGKVDLKSAFFQNFLRFFAPIKRQYLKRNHFCAFHPIFNFLVNN